jgi:hypothetical protein
MGIMKIIKVLFACLVLLVSADADVMDRLVVRNSGSITNINSANTSLYGITVFDFGEELSDKVDYSVAVTPNFVTSTTSDASPRPRTVLAIDDLVSDIDPLLVPTYAQVFTLGYATANDGGGGVFRRALSSGVTTNIFNTFQSTVNPTYSWVRVLNNSPITPQLFGAKGTTNGSDYVALQSAVNYVTTNRLELHIPAGTYILTNKLVIPVNTSGWSITGDGAGSILKQMNASGDGTPIFEFAGGGITQFAISGLTLQWDNGSGAPAPGFKNVGFMFAWDNSSNRESGVYNFSLTDLVFTFGFRCLSNFDKTATTSSGVNVWGMALEKSRSVYMNGGAVLFSNNMVGGFPNVRISDFHINGRTDGATNVTSSPFIYDEPQFYCNAANSWTFDGVELNSIATSVPVWQFSGPATQITFNGSRAEAFWLTSTRAMMEFDNVGVAIGSFEFSNITAHTNTACTLIKFDNSNPATARHTLVINSLDHQGNPDYPSIHLQPGASMTLVDAAVGTYAFEGNLPPVINATTYGRSAPMLRGAGSWRYQPTTVGTNYTPVVNATTNAPNWFRLTCASNTLNINAVTGASPGAEYVFDLSSANGTRVSWFPSSYQVSDLSRIIAAGDRMLVRMLYDGTNFVQVGQSPPWGSGNRILVANAQQGGIAALDLSTGTGANTPTNRWRISKTGTAESGASAGSDLAVERYDDSGAQTGVPLAITRSNGNVTITSTVATVNAGQTVIQGGYGNDLLIGTTGGTAGASIRAGANATALLQFNSGSLARWRLTKDPSTESGTNTGANFTIESYSDAGNYISTPLNISRATGLTTIGTLAVTTTADIGNADTTLSRLSAGRVAVEGIALENEDDVFPNTQTTATYSTTNVTITIGGRREYSHKLFLTNGNCQLAFTNGVAADRGIIELVPAATNITILLASPARSTTGQTLTITAAGSSTNSNILAWQMIGSSIYVNVGAYYR